MRNFNHIVGGLTFTSIAASFQDINIFESPVLIFSTVFFSMIPDIDHTRSVIGKVFSPLAKWLNVKHGHRTITHSIFFLLFVYFLCLAIENLFFFQNLALIAFLATFSHCFFDAMTKAGIQFFYPISSVRVVVGSPSVRLSSRNTKSELIVFAVFCVIGLASFDLVSSGVTSFYNVKMKTFAHLKSEQAKNPKNLFQIDFKKNGLEVHQAQLVTISNSEAVIFVSNSFQTISKNDSEILSISKTNSLRKIDTLIFDSMNENEFFKIVQNPQILVRVVATEKVRFKDKNNIEQLSNKLDFDFVRNLGFEVLETSTSEIEMKMTELNLKISSVRAKDYLQIKENDKRKNRLSEIETNFSGMSEYEKGKAISEIQKLKTDIQNFKFEATDLSSELAEYQILREKMTEKKPCVFSGKLILWKN